MLDRLERCQHVEYDEYKWKVSYAMPAHGKDYWTKKMEEKKAAEEVAAKAEQKSIKEKEHGHKRRKRFSLRRRSTRKGG